MRIYEFIDKYCKDLVDESKERKSLIDLAEFPHDDTIIDVEGNTIPVVIIDGESVPVADFLTMFKDDFLHVWKLPGAEVAYDNYIGALEVLEGEEALSRIRNSILAERAKLEHDVSLVTCV